MSSEESIPLLRLPADIPVAHIQAKLRAHYANLLDRVTRAEAILTRLADGCWISILNEHSPGENLGDQVLSYWTATDTPHHDHA